jgi:imidazolonepropionase-like amidohydrolase
MGLAATVGTLEAGKAADLLVLDGDPLQDIGVARRPEQRALVMQGGVPVAGTMLARGLGDDRTGLR